MAEAQASIDATTQIRVHLPVPPRQLSPNARCHFMAKAKITKQARATAAAMALSALGTRPLWKRATVKAVWHFPDARRRDHDNLMASCKAYFDGLRDAGIIEDDSGLTHEPPEIVKGERGLTLIVTKVG
jgi:crossover junction endodeoxyribonuclease RusA